MYCKLQHTWKSIKKISLCTEWFHSGWTFYMVSRECKGNLRQIFKWYGHHLFCNESSNAHLKWIHGSPWLCAWPLSSNLLHIRFLLLNQTCTTTGIIQIFLLQFRSMNKIIGESVAISAPFIAYPEATKLDFHRNNSFTLSLGQCNVKFQLTAVKSGNIYSLRKP